MGLNILKNVSVSALILFVFGCEDTLQDYGTERFHEATIWVEDIGSIDVNNGTWQSLEVVDGWMSSNTSDVTNTRVEWQSDMYWDIARSDRYFKRDCRTCDTGTWYYTDNSADDGFYDFNSMVPVTNHISLVGSDWEFHNVIAPVAIMEGDAMILWWTVGTSYIDSMLIVLD